MESTLNSGFVGGITKVMLYHIDSTLPTVGDEDLDVGTSIDIERRGCSYSEQQIYDDGLNAVTHSLTFVTRQECSPFSDSEMERVVNEGVVADVTLATGVTIRVGWSDRYGVAFPLRLCSITTQSGSQPLDYPLKSWVWSCVDITPLL